MTLLNDQFCRENKISQNIGIKLLFGTKIPRFPFAVQISKLSLKIYNFFHYVLLAHSNVSIFFFSIKAAKKQRLLLSFIFHIPETMGKGSKRQHQKTIDESIDSESETQTQGLTTLLDPPKPKKARKVVPDSDLCLVGPPIAPAEARQRWPHRYQSKVSTIRKRKKVIVLSLSLLAALYFGFSFVVCRIRLRSKL